MAELTVPVHREDELPFEQPLGEVLKADKIINFTLAQNGKAIFFYEVRRELLPFCLGAAEGDCLQPIRNIRVGPIHRVDMKELMELAAEALTKGERTWLG